MHSAVCTNFKIQIKLTCNQPLFMHDLAVSLHLQWQIDKNKTKEEKKLQSLHPIARAKLYKVFRREKKLIISILNTPFKCNISVYKFLFTSTGSPIYIKVKGENKTGKIGFFARSYYFCSIDIILTWNFKKLIQRDFFPILSSPFTQLSKLGSLCLQPAKAHRRYPNTTASPKQQLHRFFLDFLEDRTSAIPRLLAFSWTVFCDPIPSTFPVIRCQSLLDPVLLGHHWPASI